MKHMVTGGAGFIGSYLVESLKNSFPDAEVYSVEKSSPLHSDKTRLCCDLARAEDVADLIRSVKPDFIYHLAGSPRVTATTSLPEYFTKNFLTTQNLADAVARAGHPTAFFFASSVHVYGNQGELVDETAPPRPINSYGFTKYLGEEVLRDYAARCKNLRVVVGRLYSFLGPGQGAGFVAADLCRKIYSLKEGEPLRVGPLSRSRTFLDVRDGVKLFPRLLSAAGPSPYEIVNIASPNDLPIRQVLEILLRVAGKNPRIEISDAASDNKFRGFKVSFQKLQKLISPVKYRPIETTLRDMYDWISQNG